MLRVDQIVARDRPPRRHTGYTGDAKACGKGLKDKCVWNVHNSWGTSWGYQGYIRVQMGKNAGGIANDATFAKVK